MKTLVPRIASLILALASGALGAEVLLHDGPDVSTSIESFSKTGDVKEDLVFRKQFFISHSTLETLPGVIDQITDPAISATRAIETAKETVDLGQKKGFRVVRLEFLTTTTTPKPVDFYLIEMLVNGSAEHRIVLMDGSVLKPRLKQVGK